MSGSHKVCQMADISAFLGCLLLLYLSHSSFWASASSPFRSKSICHGMTPNEVNDVA